MYLFPLHVDVHYYFVYMYMYITFSSYPQVNKWFVVLHGQVRQIRDSETDKIFHIGETFGVSKSLKVLPHRGKLVTSSKDCQVSI